MRSLPFLSVLFLTAATPGFAQVTVDLHALQALPERPGPSRPSRPTVTVAPNRPAVVMREAPATNPAAPAPAASRPAAPAPAAPQAAQPAMPQSVPDTASITPIAPAPPPPGAQPPAPPPVSDKSTTTVAATTAGLRLTFASGESDLSPESSTSIKQLTASAPPGDATTFNVLAYAPGKPDDPSTARRTSLSRAMAVRGALIADGVPSARIFVRALGEQYGDGPPDRVDLSVTGPGISAGTSSPGTSSPGTSSPGTAASAAPPAAAPPTAATVR
jgi:outer membrane protein OmpA-like peptidoglycan-associated protein